MKSHRHDPETGDKPVAFRHILQAELARRCRANAQYSLRAFAKYLEVDHSTLSQLLRGKRQFTPTHIRKFGSRLGFDVATVETWLHVEEQESATDAVSQKINQLSDDIASVMTNINHYAILELTRLADFQPDSRWIANMLGITVDEVNVLLHSLLRLRMLEMVSPTRWEDRLGDAMANINAFTKAGVELYLQQLQNLLVQSVNADQKGPLFLDSTTLAISTKRLPLALEMLKDFRESFVARLSQGNEHDAVYQLQLSFLPLTNQ